MSASLLIGAPSSGCGKTTFTMGLLRALSLRGLHVQPFKSGPDYIDPLFHRQASGFESVNLDTFLASAAHVQQLFGHYGAAADVRVVEGAMGLFDGFDGPRGSASEVARLLQLPVVLLVSARSVAYSVAPLIYGFRHFCPDLRLAGVVFNFVASKRQYATLRRACEDAGVECLGYLGRDEQLVVPSRHLGLSLDERERTEQLIRRAAAEVEAHVDLTRLLSIVDEWSHGAARMDPSIGVPEADAPLLQLSVAPREVADDLRSPRNHAPREEADAKRFSRILVAQDEAFNFTYRANIDALRALGEVSFFSPLHDTRLSACDLLYLPGGYPELFAAELSENECMRTAIRDYALAGGYVLAECGGFMYLCRDLDGEPMCDVFPFRATMEGARLHLGYRSLAAAEGPVRSAEDPAGNLRGHEFHYSHIVSEETAPGLTRITGQRAADGRAVDTPVYKLHHVLAGYTHWYWADGTFSQLWKL